MFGRHELRHLQNRAAIGVGADSSREIGLPPKIPGWGALATRRSGEAIRQNLSCEVKWRSGEDWIRRDPMPNHHDMCFFGRQGNVGWGLVAPRSLFQVHLMFDAVACPGIAAHVPLDGR
jgi:hypothetical protein